MGTHVSHSWRHAFVLAFVDGGERERFERSYGNGTYCSFGPSKARRLRRHTRRAAAEASSTGYSLLGMLTPNGDSSLATSVSHASSWAVTSVTGPNSASGQ